MQPKRTYADGVRFNEWLGHDVVKRGTMDLMTQTVVVFFAGIAGGGVAYSITRDPTSRANWAGFVVGTVAALVAFAAVA